MTATIYSLVDPRSDSIVYIGKTVRDVKARYRTHCSKSGYTNGRLKRIVEELRDIGLKLDCRILEKCNPEDVDAREIFHIAKAREDGLDLCNVLRGGNGPAPEVFSEPIRAAMSKSAIRRFSRPGERERIGELISQANNRPEAIESNRQQALERMSDPARKQAVSEDRKQYYASKENRAKQSAILSSFYENNEEARKAASEKSKAQWASQEAREALSRRQKEWIANNPNFTSSQMRSVLMTPVDGGDTVKFHSIAAAGRSIGAKTNKVHHAIKKGLIISGHKFQYALT